MTKFDHHTHCLAQVSDAEVITIAIVAAKFFNNNHQNALGAMKAARYIANELNPSRFNRRIHQLSDWLEFALETVGELCRHGEVYIIDSMPLPVCQRVRAMRCKKVRGKEYCGYCATKKQKFFGCGSARQVRLRTKKEIAFNL